MPAPEQELERLYMFGQLAGWRLYEIEEEAEPITAATANPRAVILGQTYLALALNATPVLKTPCMTIRRTR